VALDDESEPEPDVMVVAGQIRGHRDAHPERAALVVEVALSSLAFDRRHKGSLYARAGVADYWIVNLVDRVVEVRRRPAPDPGADFGAAYQDIELARPGATLTPLAKPAARVAVADLLPQARVRPAAVAQGPYREARGHGQPETRRRPS